MSPILERPVTANTVANMLGVSTTTVLNMANRAVNPIPHIKIGTRYRFYVSDIAKFFNLPADKVAAQIPTNGANDE